MARARRLPARLRAGRGSSALAGLALLAASVLFYYPLVFLGRAIADYDALVYFFPQRAYLGASLAQGRLPLWNPYLFMGAPFLANVQTAVLYPPSWLFAVLPVQAGYTVQLVLHTFLAAWLTYLFARLVLGVSPLAAMVGALAYGFGGFTVGQMGHLNQLSAAAWLPAVLLGYDRAVRLRSTAWAAAGGLALALQLLAGHPQETYMTLVALGVFALVRAPWRAPRALVWAVVAGGVVGVLGLLIAAAQLIPTLELVPLSIRGAGVDWKDAVAGSLPPFLLPRALLPPFWLNVASTEYLGYGGVVPLALGLMALLAARSRFVVFGVLLCGLGIFLSTGENNRAYAALFANVPGFDTFRVPARWLFLWQVGLATLAALGAEWVRRGAAVWLRRVDLWPRALLVGLLLATGLSWQAGEGEAIPQRRTPATWGGLAAVAVTAGAVASAGRPTIAASLLVAATAVELWAAGDASPARQAPPADILAAPPATADWLVSHGGERARLLSVAQADYIPRNEQALRARMEGSSRHTIEAGIVATKWRETLAPNVPLQYRLPTADGYDGGILPLRRWLSLATLAAPAGEVRPDGVLQSRLRQPPPPRVLDLFGVQYVVANRPSPPPTGFDAVDVGDLRILARRGEAPRSELVFAASVARDSDALGRLADPRFDPLSEVLLAPALAASPLAGGQVAVPVAAQVDEPGRWVARVLVPAPAYLVQWEAWYPGWRARVDGVETPVLRANVLFRAIPLAPGEHAVEISFEPASVTRGFWLSGAGLLAAALLLAWPVWRRRVPIIPGRGR